MMNITLCIGRPTIDKAASGEAVDMGHGVTILAADDLLRSSPYALIDTLLAALEGVVRVADRKTVEFDAARTAIAAAKN